MQRKAGNFFGFFTLSAGRKEDGKNGEAGNIMKYILYADRGGGFKEYAAFTDDGEFIGDAAAAAEEKRRDAKGRAEENAAVVFRAFAAERAAVGRADFKRVMRALRRFDEVGLSNDLYDAMEELCDDASVRAAAFAPAEDETPASSLRDLSAFEI